jgi:hypothetical protein
MKNKIIISIFLGLLSVLTISSVYADEITVRTTVGDRTTQFSVTPSKDDHLLVLAVNGQKKGQVLLGNDNYEYTRDRVLELIKGKTDSPADCHRDYSTVEYRDDSGKVSKTELCLLANTSRSQLLRTLTKVMLMVLY